MSPHAPPRKRPGRPSLSNEALLDVALDLFLSQGFERTSIEAICAMAGMAKRTVYARYGDKQSLFKAALTRAIAEWIVPVEHLRAAESDDLEESLLAIARILLTNLISPAGLRLLRLTNAESGRMPEIGAFNVEQGTRPTIEYLADLFRSRIGGHIDAEFAGEAFLNLVTGPSINAAWGVAIDPAAIENHTRQAVALFLHGLLPAARPGRADDATHRHLKASLAALDQAREQIVAATAAIRLSS
jgi:TetR/AcrR family transcriptional regulator, mexJK operon transcriptional repressor